MFLLYSLLQNMCNNYRVYSRKDGKISKVVQQICYIAKKTNNYLTKLF